MIQNYLGCFLRNEHGQVISTARIWLFQILSALLSLIQNLKRLLTIVLLAIFTFNLGGYYLLFWLLKEQANAELSAKLDVGNYDESQTFEVKIPLSMPYPLQSNGFERQSGQFTYEGEQFQIVKQKLENDVLTIVCMKDAMATHIEKVTKAFTETSSDQHEDGKLNLPVKVSQEYLSSTQFTSNETMGWVLSIPNAIYISTHYQVTLSGYLPPPWA